MSYQQFMYKNRFWLLGAFAAFIIGCIVIIISSTALTKTATIHLPLITIPITTPDTPPTQNLLFNTFTTPNNTQNITTQNNLLYATTNEATINLQTSQLESVPQVTTDCQNNLQKIAKKITAKDPSCINGYQNTFAVQDGTNAYLWQPLDNSAVNIGLDENEEVLSSFDNILLTNKNGVMGIRTNKTVNAVAFHENAQLHIVAFDEKSRSFILLEIVQNRDPKRGYFHLVKINESNFPSSQIIGSTHIIPESLDPLFKPVYVEQKKVVILRTISNIYWLASLTPSQLPYLSPSGVETYAVSQNMFSE